MFFACGITFVSGICITILNETKAGGDSPDRDAQFEHINKTAKEFEKENNPVISVDCKKKELIRHTK